MWWYSRLEYSILKWISPSSASSRPQPLASTFWGIFELIFQESVLHLFPSSPSCAYCLSYIHALFISNKGKKQISRSIYWSINIIIYYIDTSVLLENIPRVVTKISSCQVNTTSRRGIKQQGISLVLFFFYFPIKVAGDHTHSSLGKSPAPGS